MTTPSFFRVVCLALFLCSGCMTAAPSATASAPAAAPSTQPVQSAAVKYRLVTENDEIIAVLENGATVIARRVPSPAVAVRGYVHTGGVFEGPWLGGGLSHLLEHLVAGGSTLRRTEAENRNLLQKIGNDSNAYTTEDHTAYFINTTPPHLDEAVDLVTGWMLGALITPDEYRREYQVVQRELEMGKGEPDRQMWYLSAMNRYRVSPARVPVIGYQEVIQGLSRDDVFNYYKLAYQPNNMIFSVAGDLDPEQMLASLKKHLADATPGRVFSHDIPAEPPVLAPRTLVASFPKLGQAKLQLAFPSVRLDDPDLYALDLLSALLSAGESSLLIEEIRDRRQLVSSIMSTSDTPSYVEGTFLVQMELDPEKIPAATQAVLDELGKLASVAVDDSRLQRAKTQMRVARVKQLQTAEEIASSLANDYLTTGDAHFSDRYIQRIQGITPEQIRKVAAKYFDQAKLLTTILYPQEYSGAKNLPTSAALTQPASEVRKFTLENGTILLLKRISTTPLVSISLYSLGGLTAEDASTNGLGNLTMEMLPRGTTSRSAQQIAEFFDSVGGDLNTACGNNSWYWQATCLKDDLPSTLDVFADIVANPSFPDSETAAMKQRVVAAIASEDSEWFPQALHFFKKKFFGPRNSPYQFMVTGTKANVSRFTPVQIREWYQRKVLASPRRVLAVFGDIDIEKIHSLLARHFGHVGVPIQAESPATIPDSIEKALVSGKPSIVVDRVEIQKTEQPLAGIVVGFESNSVIGSTENYAIDVADTMAGGYRYPTGYLHETLRGRGLVYTVQIQNWPGRSKSCPGAILVSAGCEPKNTTEVIDMILLNIARLQGADSDLQPDWFVRCKELITTADALENQTPSQQATTAALDELNGLGYNYHDEFGYQINKVTLSEVKKIARARIGRCVITVSTPDPDGVRAVPGVRTYDSFPPVELAPRGVQHDSK